MTSQHSHHTKPAVQILHCPSDMHGTGTKHIVRHSQKSVVHQSGVTEFACIHENIQFINILFKGSNETLLYKGLITIQKIQKTMLGSIRTVSLKINF